MTLRKLDIKVETVNREPLTMHSDREDDTASVSTATRVMKAIYSVRVLLLLAHSPVHVLGTSIPAPSSTNHLPSVPPLSACLGPATDTHTHTRAREYTGAQTLMRVPTNLHAHVLCPAGLPPGQHRRGRPSVGARFAAPFPHRAGNPWKFSGPTRPPAQMRRQS